MSDKVLVSQSVAEWLQELPRHERIYYRSNPGNAGDSLIAAGTFDLFRSIGVDYVILDPENFDPTDKVVVYAGGGNLNHIYSDARAFIQSVHRKAKSFVLLPHTVTENIDLLGDIGNNCVLFARENKSFDHLEKYATEADVRIDHDMAFNINVSQRLNSQYPSSISLIKNKLVYKAFGGINPNVPSIKRLTKLMLFEARNIMRQQPTEGDFFRQDSEATGRKLPPGNADLSALYEFGTRNAAYIDYTAWRLLNYVNRFRALRTDRLHVCIAGALLGKTVHFYPNAYFKCEAVYNYSLKSAFPNIIWHA